jgi:hypothetical protein
VPRLGKVVLAIATLGCGTAPESPEAGAAAIRGDFSRAAALEAWKLDDRTGGACALERERLGGRWAAVLRCERATGPLVPAARLVRRVDATPWRGHRLHLRALTWSAPQPEHSGVARLVATAVKDSGERLFRVESPGRGLPNTWAPAELVVEVGDDADAVLIEVAAFGEGTFGLADLDAEVGIALGIGDKSAAPLSADGETRLVMLARLLSILRFFGPVADPPVDWDLAAIGAVEQVENHPGVPAEALMATLGPLAPGLSIPASPSGQGSSICPGGSHRRTYLGAPFDVPMAAFERRSSFVPTTETRRATLDLGEGLEADIPLDTCATRPPAAGPIPVRPAGWAPSVTDRPTRLATAILAWGVLEQFDPERPPGSAAWEDVLRRALRELAVAGSASEATRALERLVGATNDGHALLGRPEGGREFRLPFLVADIGGEVVVTRVADDVSELHVGDRLLRFDGQTMDQALLDATARTAGATEPHRRARALENLVLRSAPHSVELEAEGIDGARRTVALAARPAGSLAKLLVAERPSLRVEADGVLSLDLRRVDDTTWEQVLPRLAAATGLIFDLRGYPVISESKLGHLSDRPLTGPKFCIPERDRPGAGVPQCSRWTVPPLEPRLRAPIVVLADHNALSYAETLLTMLVEQRLATIVGSPSAGTNGNFTGLWLPAGYRLYFTGMSAHGPDGNIRGRGVIPDVVVTPTRAGIAAGRDEVLEVAVAWLKARAGGTGDRVPGTRDPGSRAETGGRFHPRGEPRRGGWGLLGRGLRRSDGYPVPHTRSLGPPARIHSERACSRAGQRKDPRCPTSSPSRAST